MKVYVVGAGTDTCEIAAPNAATAALYYGANCCVTNDPTIAVVYEENGQEWKGHMWWLFASHLPDEKQMELIARIENEVKPNIEFSGEMLWWCPRDGTKPVYGWHGMIYRGQELYDQCDICFRDKSRAMEYTLDMHLSLTVSK